MEAFMMSYLEVGFESVIDLRMSLNCDNYVVENQRPYKQTRCPPLRFMGSGVTQYLRPARGIFYSQGPILRAASRPLFKDFRASSIDGHGLT